MTNDEITLVSQFLAATKRDEITWKKVAIGSYLCNKVIAGDYFYFECAYPFLGSYGGLSLSSRISNICVCSKLLRPLWKAVKANANRQLGRQKQKQIEECCKALSDHQTALDTARTAK